MKLSARNLIESLFNYAVFAAIALAIGSVAYQTLNPDGALFHWISRTWEADPLLLVMLGGAVMLFKRWMDGVQGAQVADLMFYGTLMLGLYFGFNLLIGA